MKIRLFFGLGLLVCSLFSFAQEEALTPEQEKYFAWAKEFWSSIEKKTGEVKIAEANAVLNVPESFYYLNAADSEKVLVDVWGNIPGQKTLGMLFPADMTPFDADSWAVTIQYEEDGYVSDKDAADIDYADLLLSMQADTEIASHDRVKQGYEPIELVGWASAPYYDVNAKKLHWAKEIKFGSQEVNTLNYNIRVLGRKGVLVLNFVAGIDQKSLIDANVDTVLALAEFDDGAKYSDFDPSIDKVAAYGLGALVAGKVVAKTGIIAIVIAFLKKFGVLILVGIGALLKSVFARRNA